MASLEELEIIIAKPENRVDPRSPLMRSKARAVKGQKINICPFGCKEKHLDHNGYCKHLVGFTRDKLTYEPLVLRKGMRRVEVPQRESGEFELDTDDDGNPVEVAIMEPDPPRLQAGDKVARISDCWRVYRKVEEQQRALPLPKVKKRSVEDVPVS